MFTARLQIHSLATLKVWQAPHLLTSLEREKRENWTQKLKSFDNSIIRPPCHQQLWLFSEL